MSEDKNLTETNLKLKTSAEDKKITELVEKAPTLEKFILNNKTKLLYVAGGVVLLVGFILGYIYFFGGNESEANEKAAKAFMYYDKNIVDNPQNSSTDSLGLDKAIKGDGQNKGLEFVAREYSNTDVGNVATYELGMAYLKKGNKDAALKHLEAFSKGKNVLSATAYGTMAAIYEDKLNKDKAIDYYKKAATSFENASISPVYWMNAGRIYEQQKKYSDALECYNKIKAEYPDSPEAKEVEKYIARAKYSM